MATQARAAYGSSLRIGDNTPLTGIAITAATNATPIVITTAAHGVVDVAVVSISGVLGNTNANNTVANPVWIAERVSATQLKLRDSAGNAAYTSGGTLIRTETYASVAEVTDIQDSGASATLVECSALDGNGWVSRLPTTLSGNAIRLPINLVPNHNTHDEITGLLFLLLTRARRNFLVVLSDPLKTAWRFTGFVQQFREALPVAGVLTAQVVIEMTDKPVLSAAA